MMELTSNLTIKACKLQELLLKNCGKRNINIYHVKKMYYVKHF